MKKINMLVILLIAMLPKSMACDICGCGAGNNYIGILPGFNRSIFGVRYRYNSLLTHVGVGGSTTYLTTMETYHTAEAWGAYNILPRLRLMAVLPYSFNAQLNQGVTKTKNGLGDASATIYYNLLNTRKTIHSKLLVQSLWLGGGIKLPTGTYNPLDKSEAGKNTNLFQLGTGSVDFMLNAMYDVRLQDAGINLAAGYKINMANRYSYSYGNKLNANLQAYYKIKCKAVTIAPNAGLLLETGDKDTDKGFSVDISGGNVLLATLGAEATFNKIAIGGNWQAPVAQNLANGIIKANNRVMVHVSFVW